MTGAEATTAASDYSAISLVCLVMMGGCAFGMAMGFPVHWVIAAVVLFLVASGYPGSAMAVLAVAVTTVHYAPRLYSWLMELDALRDTEEPDQRTRRRQQRKAYASGASQNNSGFNEFFEQATRAKAPPPRQATRQSPEHILGLSGNFTEKDLNKARRKLAKKFHPDLHRRASAKVQKQMATKMRAINAAYETLKGQVA